MRHEAGDKNIILSTSKESIKKSTLYFLLSVLLVACTVVYGYTQYTQKSVIPVILQNQIDLNDTVGLITTLSTAEYKFSNGKALPKGTQFIGMLAKEENKNIIYFDSYLVPDGEKEAFTAKSILEIKSEGKKNGVSAKISKTLYKQTKSNVLGAIFYSNSTNAAETNQQFIPQGQTLKLEFD